MGGIFEPKIVVVLLRADLLPGLYFAVSFEVNGFLTVMEFKPMLMRLIFGVVCFLLLDLIEARVKRG